MRREDLAWLLGMANDMRLANDDEPLEDLPISVPEDVGACIIANAFNYGCEVNPRNEEVGTIIFWSQADAENYCSVTGIDPTTIVSKTNSLTSGETFVVKLTPELNEVALNFDDGMYEEYNYYKWVEENDPEAELVA